MEDLLLSCDNTPVLGDAMDQGDAGIGAAGGSEGGPPPSRDGLGCSKEEVDVQLTVENGTNSSCARGGAGADVVADIDWMRERLQSLHELGYRPTYVVISFGGNALTRKSPRRSG